MSAILKVLPMRRGRLPAAVPADQQCLKLFPAHCGGRTRIYAIAFKGGVLKIGKTKTPRSRLRDHWIRGQGEVEWVHLFAPMHDRTARMVEWRAKEVLSKALQSVNKSEWFRGQIDRGEALALIRPVIDSCRIQASEILERERRQAVDGARAREMLKEAGLAHVVWTREVPAQAAA